MKKLHVQIGQQGEELALAYLLKRGYKIICKNYQCELGEIDIIARDKDTISFVEVKNRTSSIFGFPSEFIDKKKQHQIMKSALTYIKKEKIAHKNLRFDVVSICGSDLELIKDAFPLSERYIY